MRPVHEEIENDEQQVAAVHQKVKVRRNAIQYVQLLAEGTEVVLYLKRLFEEILF